MSNVKNDLTNQLLLPSLVSRLKNSINSYQTNRLMHALFSVRKFLLFHKISYYVGKSNLSKIYGGLEDNLF